MASYSRNPHIPSLLLILACVILELTVAVEFPNRIQGEPRVDCGPQSLRLEVVTSEVTPPSRIFAKGQNTIDECRTEHSAVAQFPLSGCNVNRQRQVNPKGVTYTLTVIVQMHPLFITKVDRAYHIKCFYMEADKTVTQSLGVSDMTTQLFEAGHAMPQCMYALHRDSANGPTVRYANVGDKVWHVWDCPSDVYGMLVHSCYVNDGQGNQILIVDERGCGVDDFVLQTPEYASDMTRAQQQTHVFKFADRINVAFNCQIRLCFRNAGSCQGVSPPDCSQTNAQVLKERQRIKNYFTSNAPDVKTLAPERLETPTTAVPSTSVPTTQEPQSSTTEEVTTTSATLTTDSIRVTDNDVDTETGTEILSEQLIMRNPTTSDLAGIKSRLVTSTSEPFPTPGNFTGLLLNGTSGEEEELEGSGEGDKAENATLLKKQKPALEKTPRGRRNVLKQTTLTEDMEEVVRRLRDDPEELYDIDIDSELIVLDRDENGFTDAGGLDRNTALRSLSRDGRVVASLSPSSADRNDAWRRKQSGSFCVSTLGFVGLLSLFVVSLCVTTMGAAMLLIKSRLRRKDLLPSSYSSTVGSTVSPLKYY